MSLSGELYYVTNGAIDRLSAFEANQMVSDESSAYGICDLIGDKANVIKTTPHGAIIMGDQKSALEVHNRLFSLGSVASKSEIKENEIKTLLSMRKDFAYAATRFHLGANFSKASTLTPANSNQVDMALRAA